MKYNFVTPFLLVMSLVAVPPAISENILFFHFMASYSHLVATWPLAEALAARGHQVSYISPYDHKTGNPNITIYIPDKMSKVVLAFIDAEFDINIRVQNKMPKMIDFTLGLAHGACEAIFDSTGFPDWLSKQKKVDLMIIDNVFAECAIGLAHKLGAKYALYSTVAPLGFEYDAHGLVPETSSIPDMDLRPWGIPMGFIDRMANALFTLQWRLYHFIFSMKIDNTLRNRLEMPDMPFIGDLVAKTSLIFSTSDVISTDYPRAVPPNVVNIAGIHCKETKKPLPKDMETFIQGNGTDTDGFVYISLGSMVVSSNLPPQIKKVFFDTIKAFPKLKFLWKWNGEFEKDIPENLLLGKWFPQLDVLGHPKIKAFVSQCGRPSALEALYHGVPVIGFPILGDQDFNAERMSQTGAAIKLEIGKVTLDEFKEAVRKTVYDPSTKAKMIKLQTTFRDRPMRPVETGVWWTEYLLRTEDTDHLRAAGIEQNWLVRRQIDVWAFLSISVFVIIVSSLVITMKLARKIFKIDSKLKKA